MTDPNRTDDEAVLVQRPDDRALLASFESLGGSGHGDEFGLLQQRFGVDAPGLLSGADLHHDLLSAALEARLDGVGQPENTIVFVPDGSDAWWSKDSRYWMATRSSLKAATVSLEQAVSNVTEQLRKLRDKLIGDLQAAGKIFVFRNIWQNLTATELARLHAAVRAYGEATLFYVRYADAAHPAGTVVAAADGLIVGYIAHFAFTSDDAPAGDASAGWLALCRAARNLSGYQRVEAEPDKPTAARPRQSTRERRIVFLGNCQLGAMARLYERFVTGRTGDILTVVASYEELSKDGEAALAQADIIVEQVLDLQAITGTGRVTTSATKLFIPMVTAAFLWPFGGQAHPRNRAYKFLEVGPYGGEAGDSWLNRAILAGKDPVDTVDAYMELDVPRRTNLDRLYELVMDRQRSRDEATGYRMADVIEAHFRTELVFLTPYHPNTRVAVALATQLFRQLDVAPDDIERMQQGTRQTPFPKWELPLHPSVCRHFGMDFVKADRRYRFLNEGAFTFREAASRYMRYEWNEALEHGLYLNYRGQTDAAFDLLKTGLATSPNSAEGQDAIGHILARRNETDAAIAALSRAAEIEPGNPDYHANLANHLRQNGRATEAEAALRAAVAAEPEHAHYHVLLAHLLRDHGKRPEALEQMKLAARLDPYASAVRIELANQLEAAGDSAAAVAELAACAAFRPADAPLHHRLAHALAAAGRIADAVKAARGAIAADPETASYRVLLSDLLLRDRQPKEALIEAYAAIFRETVFGDAHRHLAHVLRHTGDEATAVKVLERAAGQHPGRMTPEQPTAPEASGGIAGDIGAAGISPGDARGAVPRPDGVDAPAIATIRTPKLDPDRLARLAETFMSTNDFAGAAIALRKALELAPERIEFQSALSRLEAHPGEING